VEIKSDEDSMESPEAKKPVELHLTEVDRLIFGKQVIQ
jgi:hypothetical protein